MILCYVSNKLTTCSTGGKIALKEKNWLRHSLRIGLAGGVLLFAGLLFWRELEQGWADIFQISHGKFDILPMAVLITLLGSTYGKNGLRLTAQAVLIGIVFLFLGRSIHRDWSQITGRDWRFNLPWLAASLLLMCGLYASHAAGWLLVLWRFRHPVSFLPGFYVWSKSLLARYVPGNVLMVVGRVMMIEPYGVPKKISLTSVVYEQALLAASSATVLSLALSLWPDLRNISSLIWLVLFIPPLAIVGLHPAIMGRIGNFALTIAGREPIEEFLPFKTVIGLIIYYCLTWAIAGVGLFALVRAVTMIDFVDMPIVIASVPLAWLFALMVFISPSGLGVREGVYAYTLAFAFDHEAGVASAFAILARFWQTLIEIAFVVVIMGIVKKYKSLSR